MGKIVSIFNQKGGVGKTTTTINLATGISLLNKKVLIIDLDPQGNCTSGLGVYKNSLDLSIYDILGRDKEVSKSIKSIDNKNLDLIGSNSELAGLEIELANLDKWQYILKEKLKEIESEYDFIFIDCPPSLGILSIIGLVASDSMIIPIQSEYYALEGVSELGKTIELIKNNFNSNLSIEGIVMTMYDNRTNLSTEVSNEVESFFKNYVYKTKIPRNVRLAEAPSHGMSIFDYEKNSKGAKAYNSLAIEFLTKNGGVD